MKSRYAYSFIAFLISAMLHAALWGFIINYNPEKPVVEKKIVMQVSMFKQTITPKPIVKQTTVNETPEAKETEQLPASLLPKPAKDVSKRIKEKTKAQNQPVTPIVPVKAIKTPHKKSENKPKSKPKKIAKASPKKEVKKVKKIKKKVKQKAKQKAKNKIKVKKKIAKKPVKKPKPPQPPKKVVRRPQSNPKATTPRRPVRVAQNQPRQPTKVVRNNAGKPATGSRHAIQKRAPSSQRSNPNANSQVKPKAKPKAKPKTKPSNQLPTRRKNPSIANPQLENRYGQSVKQLIERQKRYPKRAKRMRKQGVVKVGFSLNKSGVISNLRIVQSSGNSSLDKATLQAVKKVGRFPVFPAGIAKQSIRYIIPIAYKLR